MLDIHTKNLTLSSSQEGIIKSKLEKLFHLAKRLNDESTKMKVEIDYDKIQEKHKRIFTTVTIFAPKKSMRAETHASSVENSIDECEKKLRVQVEKFKTKV
ncbi:MAG: HPF/RaiA family ribosome-associated protein [Candidatus Gracilibacteria bacterium]|jgi:ribosome-associated translation inhibitor RaiA|nr:HPF/RaiA family ribosome-associated protein [Candidatus Gracilibacteria bacterium]